ncbi:MAG TPA: VWA domain-containing protein [Vicinamibacterales bacterium]|nr:VWA domain-containing protein [Vicinamibacterales bacterium]
MAALLVIVAQAQQTPPPTFRSATHLIVQTVSVKDKKGQPVEGLTAKDFVVTEDGQPQQIAFVEYQPLDAAPRSSPSVQARAPSAVPPATDVAVSVPLPGDVRYRGRRLIVLYFDLYNMSFFDQLRVYASAHKYIATGLTPADLVAIMVFQNGAVRTKLEFTDDRAALGEAVRQLEAAADEAFNGGGLAIQSGGAFGEDDDTFNLFTTDRQLAALQTAVTDLGPLPEVKTLIYLGSGLRLNGADNQAQLRATVNAAVRSNVTINPIDTRGLVATPPLGDATRASPGGVGMFSGAIAQAATIRQQQAQDTYYALAKDTGGRAMFDYNDLSLGMVQAAQAVTGYYMIGYYTTNTALDGRFRRVRIALTNDLPADLAYRPGYYGAKDYARFNAADKERQLEEALKLEDPITDIPIAVEVNYFQLDAAEYFVPVSVRMPGSELTRPRETSARAEIDMIGEVKDEYGVTIRNAKDRLAFTLDPAKAAQVARRPIQYETGFTLLPGKYAIKILARDTTTGRIGTFLQSFTVPNLEREHVRLPISSVVLATQRASRGDALFNVKEKVASDVGNPLVQDGRKLIPSVTRTFSAGRPLFVFLESYERDASVMRPLVAFVAFYRDGAKAFETEPLGVSEGLDPKSKAVPIRFTIDPGRLQPGSYDCQVTVLDPSAGRAAFWRTPVTVVR